MTARKTKRPKTFILRINVKQRDIMMAALRLAAGTHDATMAELMKTKYSHAKLQEFDRPETIADMLQYLQPGEDIGVNSLVLGV